MTIPQGFSFTTSAFYSLFLRAASTVPILLRQWSSFTSRRFSLSTHWSLLRDSFPKNVKNDLAWLISLRAVKVRHSLRNWGYINSFQCASCRRVETIDHCFLNCTRVKPVWAYFTPLLCAVFSSPFSINCAFFFFLSVSSFMSKESTYFTLYIIKTILYGIWVFRNKGTFHTGKERSKAIIKYITSDVKKRVLIDKFRSLWTNPALRDFRANDYLVFLIMIKCCI